ncbi:P-loop containing nucleoside triphosphate hydrolase protein [Linnemannia elongata]|nr:P-loop containing nucleoside triphosphate hydrolase protein [Linnemannia elongata]
MQQLLANDKSASLLSLPIHRMIDELELEIRNQKQDEVQRLLDGDDDVLDLDEDPSSGSNERLWVDKYRPKNYTDLMGDERVNREVLSWIKQWDQCVFGRKFNKFTPEYKKQQFKEFRKPDALGRPDRKVLLLTGPPGLGKTTMAHVIARQAGYNVIEVNASDDRTGASIKGKIEAALEIQSILGSDKPNMLIIDEIDGVSSSGGEQSFIKLLVDIATVEVMSKEENTKSGGGNRKNKKFTKRPLMRPIICICNDQYAPVLRPLRTIAQIYQFRKPSVRTVVNRLQQICEIEQVPSDTRAFGVLYEMTEGDMRSCLNTLQFIKNKSRASGLTVETLTRSTIGRKDQNKSLFSVWEEIFQATYARKTRNDNNTYVSRMVSIIQTNGDYDKLMQGCFENYPTMIFHDVAMNKVVENTEWLAFYDQLNFKVSANFEYEVGGYMAYALANYHRFFAGSVRQKIEYPRKDYESFVAHKANESILQGMALNLPVKIQRHFRKSNFATELLSPFLRILSPFLRPVNKQLIKPDEREVLKRLVDIMINFQLTFVQEKTEDGQFLYRLEPSIEKLGDFSTIGLKNVLTNRYAVRQLIAQEIEMELVRRAEAVKEAKVGAFFGKAGQGQDAASMESAASASLATAAADAALTMKEATDFFGRAIVVQDKNTSGGGGVSSLEMERSKKKTRIWYKFNEGFSNAVKAKVFINELL